MAALIGAAERAYITHGAEADVRNDGRRREDFRQIEIELGVIAQCSGSARVRVGGTDVIVGVKAEIGAPDGDRPDAGRLQFSVECSPVASPAFQGRGGDELGSELTRALERSMLAGGGGGDAAAPLDLSALRIVAGKTCWVLYVDALVLAMDGAVADAVSVAVKAALADTRVPRVDIVRGDDPGDEPEYEVDDDPEAAARLDCRRVPLTLTMCRLGGAAVADPTAAEEACAAAALEVAVDAAGAVCGVTKRRRGAVEAGALVEMVGAARRLGPRLHAAVDAFVAGRS
jgi:exosome complex component RRP42